MEERFLSKVDKNGPNGCWNWTASKNDKGYGKQVYGKEQIAHRVSYELFVGKIPDGLCVLHSCDNRACVNPAHLSVGTHQQNMKERNERGRQSKQKGQEHGQSKLTEDEVREIRVLLKFDFTGIELAKMYDVYYTTISKIKLRKTWSHVV